jgi:death-on-curing protein
MKYLTKERILRIHRSMVELTGEPEDVLNESSLELSVEAPRRVVFGTEIYGSLPEKAAALMHELCKLHAFLAANKRTAFAATDVFMRLNGWRLESDVSQAVKVSVETAICAHDIPFLAEWVSRTAKRV